MARRSTLTSILVFTFPLIAAAVLTYSVAFPSGRGR